MVKDHGGLMSLLGILRGLCRETARWGSGIHTKLTCYHEQLSRAGKQSTRGLSGQDLGLGLYLEKPMHL